jgi:TonB family protein
MLQVLVAGVVLALLQANSAPERTTIPTAAPPSAKSSERIITNPDWAIRPEKSHMTLYWPAGAAIAHVGGHVLLDCQVKANGRLTHCKAAEESPKGWGFGDAAIYMAGGFQMKPMTIDGQSVAGAHVRIPINFGWEK